MTCKECLHYKACKSMLESMGFEVEGAGENAEERCDEFEAACEFAPVVHGRWEVVEFIDPHGFMVERRRRCSLCREFANSKKRNFCNNCGAMMDEEEQK